MVHEQEDRRPPSISCSIRSQVTGLATGRRNASNSGSRLFRRYPALTANVSDLTAASIVAQSRRTTRLGSMTMPADTLRTTLKSGDVRGSTVHVGNQIQ